MYIKSMVIDGFKSYAQRTEIGGFDTQFNAITGLNGSGKSNILDAICFLLGITNLTQVRATNLNELVYKNGQGGITKATVNITFDNTNKNNSPVGYQHMDEITVTRQIAIGNRNKYLINGTNVNNNRVHDLFRSVQLNVNNPHFLIMQGRITKVLNMKPPEILSMIEEATGTRLYESKKETAQKTIEKKEAKLREIDSILREEINPAIEKLKSERASYLEYEKIRREYDHLNMQFIAYQFNQYEDLIQTNQENLNEMKTGIQNMEDEIKGIKKMIENNEKLINEIAKKRDQETGNLVKELEHELDECKKKDAKTQTTMKHQHDEIKSEKKKLRDLENQFENENKSIEASKIEIEKLKLDLIKLEDASKLKEDAFLEAQSNLKAVKNGLTRDEDGKESSLNQQLINAEKEIAKAEMDIKQATIRLKHSKDELKKKQEEITNKDNHYKNDQATYERLKDDLNKLENDLEKLDYTEGTEEDLIQQRKGVEQNLKRITDMTENVESRYPQLQFEFKDPERNFNRNAVHGLVATLISVKEAKYATAIEVVAGGKLYQVVVDTEQNGKKLLQNGELKRRVTIIPLNKISGSSIPQDIVKKAEQIAGRSNVNTALSLVDFNKNLIAAMEYVFGNCFVCNELNMAKRVAFDDKVHRKTVTLDGDSFDPAGLLTGGSRSQTSSILLKLNEIKLLKNDLNETRHELQKLDQHLNKVKATASRWREMKQHYDLKNQEAQVISDRMKQSNHGQHLAKIDELKQDIVAMETLLKQSQELLEKYSAKQKLIKDSINNSGAMRDNDIKNAEEMLEKSKKIADEAIVDMREKQQEIEILRLELVELEKEHGNVMIQITTLRQHIVLLESKLEQHDYEATKSKENVEKLQAEVNYQKNLLKEANKEINEHQQEIQKLNKSINDKELEIQEMSHKINNDQEIVIESKKMIEKLLKSHSWIEEQRPLFGKQNTPYDFKLYDIGNIDRRRKNLETTKEKLSKNVNERAMNMLGKAEQQHDTMMKKRKIVVTDKKKIEVLMIELDEKKKEALTVAYTQVTKDFGSIFSTLLPGATAKLTAPNGKTILDGLEFRVGFGGAWKESLSELSGGQRSLVALSLILALLRFNPAPLYILDEVDAALDISHTQNIGHMLKTHFQNSQFIVVSLKDGMFNNANVLFKTSFVDGVSTVTRHAHTRKNSISSNHSSINKNNAKAKKRLNEESL